MTALAVPQISVVKILVDDLADMGIAPLHFKVDSLTVGDRRPNVSLWMQTRTDFEHVCTRWALKARERYAPQGQRAWAAEKDTELDRLLVQCVSFEHHTDWQPRRP